eukprot:Nk52_evm24s150 gene=Nk52_evmTU24s150
MIEKGEELLALKEELSLARGREKRLAEDLSLIQKHLCKRNELLEEQRTSYYKELLILREHLYQSSLGGKKYVPAEWGSIFDAQNLQRLHQNLENDLETDLAMVTLDQVDSLVKQKLLSERRSLKTLFLAEKKKLCKEFEDCRKHLQERYGQLSKEADAIYDFTLEQFKGIGPPSSFEDSKGGFGKAEHRNSLVHDGSEAREGSVSGDIELKDHPNWEAKQLRANQDIARLEAMQKADIKVLVEELALLKTEHTEQELKYAKELENRNKYITKLEARENHDLGPESDMLKAVLKENHEIEGELLKIESEMGGLQLLIAEKEEKLERYSMYYEDIIINLRSTWERLAEAIKFEVEEDTLFKRLGKELGETNKSLLMKDEVTDTNDLSFGNVQCNSFGQTIQSHEDFEYVATSAMAEGSAQDIGIEQLVSQSGSGTLDHDTCCHENEATRAPSEPAVRSDSPPLHLSTQNEECSKQYEPPSVPKEYKSSSKDEESRGIRSTAKHEPIPKAPDANNESRGIRSTAKHEAIPKAPDANNAQEQPENNGLNTPERPFDSKVKPLPTKKAVEKIHRSSNYDTKRSCRFRSLPMSENPTDEERILRILDLERQFDALERWILPDEDKAVLKQQLERRWKSESFLTENTINFSPPRSVVISNVNGYRTNTYRQNWVSSGENISRSLSLVNMASKGNEVTKCLFELAEQYKLQTQARTTETNSIKSTQAIHNWANLFVKVLERQGRKGRNVVLHEAAEETKNISRYSLGDADDHFFFRNREALGSYEGWGSTSDPDHELNESRNVVCRTSCIPKEDVKDMSVYQRLDIRSKQLIDTRRIKKMRVDIEKRSKTQKILAATGKIDKQYIETDLNLRNGRPWSAPRPVNKQGLRKEFFNEYDLHGSLLQKPKSAAGLGFVNVHSHCNNDVQRSAVRNRSRGRRPSTAPTARSRSSNIRGASEKNQHELATAYRATNMRYINSLVERTIKGTSTRCTHEQHNKGTASTSRSDDLVQAQLHAEAVIKHSSAHDMIITRNSILQSTTTYEFHDHNQGVRHNVNADKPIYKKQMLSGYLPVARTYTALSSTSSKATASNFSFAKCGIITSGNRSQTISGQQLNAKRGGALNAEEMFDAVFFRTSRTSATIIPSSGRGVHNTKKRYRRPLTAPPAAGRRPLSAQPAPRAKQIRCLNNC